MAGALAFVPAAALAQEAPAAAPAQDAPPSTTVGPSALENFSLNGTVTHAADQPAAAQPSPKRPAPAEKQPAAADQPSAAPTPASTRDAAATPTPAPAPRQARTIPVAPAPQAALPQAQPQAAPQVLRQSSPASSVTATLPALNEAGPSTAEAPAATPTDFAPAPAGPGHGFPLWPWLLAALVLGAGGAFLFWRNRSREALAGGPVIDAFAAPEPAPAPRAAPAPPRAVPTPPPVAAPQPAPRADGGIVSSRLRPWIEIGFTPTRCILSDESLVVEFELELFNSGSQPARSVRVDVALFNAGNDQDEQIGKFIDNPVGAGESIDIQPLKRVGITAQVAIARSEVKAYEMAGSQVFLPVIAFNALYGAGSAQGQTSTSYLLGRDTKGEKLGPFRITGPRIYRGIGARDLPTSLRR